MRCTYLTAVHGWQACRKAIEGGKVNGVRSTSHALFGSAVIKFTSFGKRNWKDADAV